MNQLRPWRLSKKDEVNKQIDEWLATGIVQPSISGYINPIVLVTKRDERWHIVTMIDVKTKIYLKLSYKNVDVSVKI